MDPDATLEEIRGLARYLRNEDGEVGEFAAAVEALDQWLSAGGFLPAPWNVRQ